MGCNKIGSKREVHSNSGLLQKQEKFNFMPKGTSKTRKNENRSQSEERNSKDQGGNR